MKFSWSTLRVTNLEDSIRFYFDVLGLQVVNRFIGGHGVEIAFLGDGDTKIELICDGCERAVNTGEDISWGFEVESLEDVMALLKEKNIPIASGPVQPSSNIRFIFINDPDGMRIQIAEHL